MACQWKGCDRDTTVVQKSGGYYRNETTYQRKYCSDHRAARRTENGKFLQVGDERITSGGYVYIYTEEGTQAKHRYVMEQRLGRKLRKGESVHHINGDKLDNRDENLELWVGAIRYGQRATDITCPHCGEGYGIK
jgi:hypothetical protein